MDSLEKKKFKVKKRLFELISPYDEEEKRLEEVMAMAHIKTLPGIFRLARQKTYLIENNKSSRRHIPSNQDNESPSHINNHEVKSSLFNKETHNYSKILNNSSSRQNAFLNTPRKPTHTISSASSYKNKYFNNSNNINSLRKTTTFKNNFKSKIENYKKNNENKENNDYYTRNTTNRERGSITNNQIQNHTGILTSNYTTENIFFGKSKAKLKHYQIEQNLSKLKEARGQVKKLIMNCAIENQTFRNSLIIPKDVSTEMKLRKSMSNFNSTSHSKFLSSFI